MFSSVERYDDHSELLMLKGDLQEEYTWSRTVLIAIRTWASCKTWNKCNLQWQSLELVVKVHLRRETCVVTFVAGPWGCLLSAFSNYLFLLWMSSEISKADQFCDEIAPQVPTWVWKALLNINIILDVDSETQLQYCLELEPTFLLGVCFISVKQLLEIITAFPGSKSCLLKEFRFGARSFLGEDRMQPFMETQRSQIQNGESIGQILSNCHIRGEVRWYFLCASMSIWFPKSGNHHHHQGTLPQTGKRRFVLLHQKGWIQGHPFEAPPNPRHCQTSSSSLHHQVPATGHGINQGKGLVCTVYLPGDKSCNSRCFPDCHVCDPAGTPTLVNIVETWQREGIFKFLKVVPRAYTLCSRLYKVLAALYGQLWQLKLAFLDPWQEPLVYVLTSLHTNIIPFSKVAKYSK